MKEAEKPDDDCLAPSEASDSLSPAPREPFRTMPGDGRGAKSRHVAGRQIAAASQLSLSRLSARGPSGKRCPSRAWPRGKVWAAAGSNVWPKLERKLYVTLPTSHRICVGESRSRSSSVENSGPPGRDSLLAAPPSE